MELITDSYFKEVVVSIIKSCHGSLIQDLIGESKSDLFALQDFLENHITSNQMLFQIARKCFQDLHTLKYGSGDTLQMAQVCTSVLHDIHQIRLQNA